MLASCLFAVAVLLGLCWQAAPAGAENGDRYSRLRPLFQFDQPRAAPRRAAKPAPARRKGAAVRRPAAEPKPRRRAAPTAAAALPPKAGDAKVVLVVGDFFGQALAAGLEEGFADVRGVRIENAAVPRRSLTAGGIGLPDDGKPAALVVMLGGNDRRSLSGEGARLPLRSPGWNAVYERRTRALVAAAREQNTPLFWVGLPVVASSKASADFLAFNELFRAAAEEGGGVFIDSWDGFVNEAGAFVTFGSGVDGQNTRLRTKDGIGFTRAGRRKLAFFAARPLAKALDLPLPAGAAPEAQDGAPAGTLGPGRTAPMALTGYTPDAAEPGELLGAAVPPKPATDPGALYDVPAVPGRADDFSAAPAATLPAPPEAR